MKSYYGSRISDNLSRTPEGYLVCHAVRIARTGWQEYLSDSIDPEGEFFPNGKIIRVYRSPEQVFHPAAMASAEGKTVTDLHPNEWVNSQNESQYNRGHGQNIRRDPVTEVIDGETVHFLLADLVIKDAGLIAKVEPVGGRRDVSCGYRNIYVPLGEAEAEQKDIRHNHFAIVPTGRAGRECGIKDAAETEPVIMEKSYLISLGLASLASNPAEFHKAVKSIATLDAAEEKEPEPKPKPKAKETEDEEEDETPAEKKKREAKETRDAEGSAVEQKLDVLIGLMSKAMGTEVVMITGDADEPKPITEDESDLIVEEGAAPKNPITEDAKAFLKSIRPLVAKSKDSAMIGQYNKLVMDYSTNGDAAYSHMRQSAKPESVKNAEGVAGVGSMDAKDAPDFFEETKRWHRQDTAAVSRN